MVGEGSQNKCLGKMPETEMADAAAASAFAALDDVPSLEKELGGMAVAVRWWLRLVAIGNNSEFLQYSTIIVFDGVGVGKRGKKRIPSSRVDLITLTGI